MENYDPYDDESVDTEQPISPPAPKPSMMGGLPAPGPGQYRTPEGVLINGTPPPPPPDYDRAAAIAELYRRVPVKQANDAILAATRLEGMLGFDADRKAGVPVMEALQKWSPKMYADHPSAIASLQKAGAAAAQAPFVPSMTELGGEKLFHMGPNRYQFAPEHANFGEVEIAGQKYIKAGPRHLINVPKPIPDPMVKAQVDDIKSEIKLLDKQIGNALSEKDIPPLEAKKTALRLQRDALLGGKSHASGPSVKRLVWKDGQLVPKE